MPEPPSVHVPAWKKLGLKLKFANEEPYSVSKNENESNGHMNDKKRKNVDLSNELAIESVDTARSKKKVKRPKFEDDGPILTSIGRDTTAGEIDLSSATTPDTTKGNRKSVSFTPETKAKDGDGVKKLYNDWIDTQIANDPSFDPTTINPALRPVDSATVKANKSIHSLKSTSGTNTPTKSDSLPHKSKKLKKKNVDTSLNISSPSDHPALTYLTVHHTSPSTWKFSKSQQNYLLKHLFSLTHIPPSYDCVLLGYLGGLQGSARLRIRQEALAIRTDDTKWLSSEPGDSEKMDQETDAQCIARRKRDYEAAITRVKQQLRDKEDKREDIEWEMLGDREEWEQRVRKRRRAEIVLWCVGEDEEVTQDAVALPKHEALKIHQYAKQEPVTIQSRGMGGVEQISSNGIAKDSKGKKIIFDENGTSQAPKATSMNETHEIRNRERTHNTNGIRRKTPRKRKPRTGMPDDDSTTSESSSISSEESADEGKNSRGNKQPASRNGASDTDTSSSSSSESSSDSESDSD